MSEFQDTRAMERLSQKKNYGRSFVCRSMEQACEEPALLSLDSSHQLRRASRALPRLVSTLSSSLSFDGLQREMLRSLGQGRTSPSNGIPSGL